MAKTFTPSLREFQKDVENYLKHEGKCEKNERGQIVYRGYEAAVGHMFQVYMDEGAFAPLVDEFRKWNWEWSYNSYLLGLTARLTGSGNWFLLEKLWAAVIAKRRNQLQQDQKGARGRSGRGFGGPGDKNQRTAPGGAVKGATVFV